MVIRFKVDFDNGKIVCKAGETTSELADGYAMRLVRSGLAEAVAGNRGLNKARKAAGMKPVRRQAKK